jgi:hypothetical protein
MDNVVPLHTSNFIVYCGCGNDRYFVHAQMAQPLNLVCTACLHIIDTLKVQFNDEK